MCLNRARQPGTWLVVGGSSASWRQLVEVAARLATTARVAWHARARARPASASKSSALGSRVEVSVGSSTDSWSATASWKSRAERRATHGTGAHGGQEAVMCASGIDPARRIPFQPVLHAEPVPAGTWIGPRVSPPSPAATARRQTATGGPGPRDAHEQRIVGDPDVRPTGTSRQYGPINSGALLPAPAKQRRRRSKHTGDALLDVGLELPVAWVEALIPNGLSGTAAVPRPPLPTSFRPGC